ncbi:hypothetical protein [Neobacillus sp. FSL H8-0543]|uniref:hypothetical protein n=1 Tax=Neobacillus sp. FSL H8-0543 TaxID=2954672 RepID=UPI003158DC54
MKQNRSMPNAELFETVCINCPGSLWGEKSICRIHNKSIGEIASCEQWTRQTTDSFKDDEGQLAFTDLEPAIEIVQKTEEDLHSYHWMFREIERLKKDLNEAIKTFGPSSRLTAIYGDEAGMPQGQGLKLSSMSISEQRFDRQWQRLKKLEQKMERINHAANQITDDKERTVLECILDGVRMNMVARHVGISRTRLNEIKRLIVKKMAWVLYEEELKG